MKRIQALLLIAVLAPACGQGADANTNGNVATPAPMTTPPPGALNPAVTQQSIGTTICVSGVGNQPRPRRLPQPCETRPFPVTAISDKRSPPADNT